MTNVLKTKTHVDNPRLLGFVARNSGTGELHCYTFESNADGDDVCCAINTAMVMRQSKVIAILGSVFSVYTISISIYGKNTSQNTVLLIFISRDLLLSKIVALAAV